MALVRCSECNRDISDFAVACPGCGAPRTDTAAQIPAPTSPLFEDGHFHATRAQLGELARAAIVQCGYRVDAGDEIAGTVGFTTGVTMGSWSGVSATLIFTEAAPYRFDVTGTAKQNVHGGQMVALNLFGEAQQKVENVIAAMRSRGAHPAPAPDPARPPADYAHTDSDGVDSLALVVIIVVLALLAVAGLFSFSIGKSP